MEYYQHSEMILIIVCHTHRSCSKITGICTAVTDCLIKYSLSYLI